MWSKTTYNDCMNRIYQHLSKHVSRYWAYYFLFFVQISLFFINYRPGTFLVGWDNLFPELNFGLNLKRAFFAVWQEYRGMGVVDNMSHASTLIEDLQRLFLSLFMPTSMVRWVYLFILHMIGGMGILHLLKNYFLKSTTETTRIQAALTTVISLVAALFYQHNLGTIQQMYLPMEVFVVHFAYLPWLVWATLKSLETGSRKYFGIFGLLSILATPQAHVPTLFIVYAMAIGIISTWYVAFIDRTAWKSALMIAIISFATNAFWFLPFVYATITHSDVVANSKAFQMASNDIFYRNHEYGNIKDIALIKGTLLEYYYYNFKANTYHFMFEPWLKHIDSWAFSVPAWISFFLALGGTIATFLKYKNARVVAALFIFSIFMLGTDIPIVGKINELLREYVPLFKTVFRFVFTKFSILYVFAFSIMLGIGIQFFVELLKNRAAKILTVGITALLIVIYISPSFRGYFFYDNLRIDIPNKYFQTFEFFKNQDHNTRIAMLPTPWYWSWLQPDWGAINSGFFWYAVPQPTTDLAFTPWSDDNENFYWELERAVNLNDQQLLDQVLQKYDISWLYLDTSVMNAESKKVTYDDLQQFLLSSPYISQAEQFDDIYIYSYNNSPSQDFLSAKSNIPIISYDTTYIDYDRVYENVGDYQKALSTEVPDRTYPFYSLFSGKASYLNTINVHENDNAIVLKGNTGLLGEDATVNNTLLTYNPVIFIPTIDESVSSILPQAQLVKSNDEIPSLDVVVDKDSSRVYSSNNDKWYLIQSNDACETSTAGSSTMFRYQENGDTVYKLTSVNSSNCVKVEIPSIDLRYGYLLKIRYEADSKRGWFVNIYNKTRNSSVGELYLQNNGKENTEYIVLPPQATYDLGYNIYFNNKSEGIEKVTNTLKSVELYQIPYMEMKDLYVENRPIRSAQAIELHTTQHSVPFQYFSTLQPEVSSTLILQQAFDPGWDAYEINCQSINIQCQISKFFPFFIGEKIETHVKVNNWANGFRLRPNENVSTDGQGENELANTHIVIIFWPQYLQFLGFTILICAIVIYTRSLLRKTYDSV